MPDERIAKLPKWAREYIEKLERERDIAVRDLRQSLDTQTPSPFFVEDRVSGGKVGTWDYKCRYVQTHKITVEYKGIHLEVYAKLDENGIDLQWGSPDEGPHHDIALIPASHQSARLVSKENMR